MLWHCDGCLPASIQQHRAGTVFPVLLVKGLELGTPSSKSGSPATLHNFKIREGGPLCILDNTTITYTFNSLDHLLEALQLVGSTLGGG